MIDSGIVDLAIGMLFIFLVFSLVVSGINEGLTKFFAWRSRHLWRALRQLLDGGGDKLTKDERPKAGQRDPNTYTGKLYAHPLIHQLEGRIPTARTRLEKIPSKDFARALIDALVPNEEGRTTVDAVRAKVKLLPASSPMRRPLLALLNEAGSDLKQLRGEIEEWFDARMVALSKAYRRHARYVLIVIGLGVAWGMNVDAIGAAQALYRDEALRSAVATQASSVVEKCEDETDVVKCTKDRVGKIDKSLELPVGWANDDDGVDALQVLGWILAGIALGQGAPFWFDLLRKARQFRK